MKPRIYIETTIPSYYYETRQSAMMIAWRLATRKWWEDYRGRYESYTSKYVLAELRLAPVDKAKRAASLLRNLPLLEDPPGFREVLAYYLEHHLMPIEAEGDAAHLALASMHHMDFLLTWNCRHLANANKIQHLTVLNGRLGLPVPVVTTPLNLMPEEMV